MDQAAYLTAEASNQILARSGVGGNKEQRPPAYKAVGLSLAVASGLFIGTSFVLKKVGLLKANVKYNEEAGEGYGYLKNVYWWSGMTLMIIGEICNFVAYAFVDAILVTPLGALSVVVTTILSAIFLKERLSFVGKIGCFICIIGSIIIVLNAPEQSSVADIQEMQHFVIAPGFLSYAGVVIIGCAFTAFWAGPRYGKKSMLVYLTVCSFIGGLSVVATQGLGAAVVAQAGGEAQFNKWFLYVLLVFVVATLLTEIIYLNKALNLYNAALVTPTYYVYFTSCTIVSSAILFRGFHGSPISIATIVMGFLTICAGVVLLQLSKSAKDLPDSAVFTGDLDQVRTVAEQEQPESEPKADAIRGTAALIRRLSQSRQKMEADEARRVYEDRLKDQMEPIGENEQVEWDGVRRRKTIRIDPGELSRRKSMHPPLGLSKFPDYNEEEAEVHRASHELNNQNLDNQAAVTGTGFFPGFRRRASGSGAMVPFSPDFLSTRPSSAKAGLRSPSNSDGANLTTIPSGQSVEMKMVPPVNLGSRRNTRQSAASSQASPSVHAGGKPIMWASDAEPSASAKAALSPQPLTASRRQFSFQNLIGRGGGTSGSDGPSKPWLGGSRPGSKGSSVHPDRSVGTEEERLGLVKGDSHRNSDDEDEAQPRRSIGRHPVQSDLAVHTNRAPALGLQLEPRPGLKWSGSSPELRTPGMGRPLPKTPTADADADDDEDLGSDVEKELKEAEAGRLISSKPPSKPPSKPSSRDGKGDGTGPGGVARM